ncbi:hypothetical protein [Martelella lutilitoris]|nr:hypothetical protein [Martelella lutilitoris]
MRMTITNAGAIAPQIGERLNGEGPHANDFIDREIAGMGQK